MSSNSPPNSTVPRAPSQTPRRPPRAQGEPPNELISSRACGFIISLFIFLIIFLIKSSLKSSSSSSEKTFKWPSNPRFNSDPDDPRNDPELEFETSLYETAAPPLSLPQDDFFNVQACNDFYEHACADTIAQLVDLEEDSIFSLARHTNKALLTSRLNSSSFTSNSSALAFFATLYAKCEATRSDTLEGYLYHLFDTLNADYHLLSPRDRIFQMSPASDPEKPATVPEFLELFTNYYTATGSGALLTIDMIPVLGLKMSDLKDSPKASQLYLGLESTADAEELPTVFIDLLVDYFQSNSSVFTEITDLQSRLAQPHPFYSVSELYTSQTSLTLGKLATSPRVDWTALMNQLLRQSSTTFVSFSETTAIYADTPSLNFALKIVTSTPLRVLRNYFTLRYFLFLGTLQSRSSCLPETDSPIEESFIFLLSRVFVDASVANSPKSTVEAVRSKVQAMSKRLEESLRTMLYDSSSAIDSFTRQVARVKLRHFVGARIGYEDWYMDDGQLDAFYGMEYFVPPDEELGFMDSLRAWIHHSIELKFSKGGAQSIEKLWNGAVFKTGAWTNQILRTIFIPLGYLMAPTFAHNASLGATYGAIGFTIGHELLHNLHFSRQASFNRSAHCFIAQYGAIVDPTSGAHLDGAKTVDEDIADNGAIKVAFRAFQGANGHAHSAGPYRQFFYSFAKQFCEVPQEKDTLATFIKTDTHTLSKYRINVVLSNFEPFARAFNCPVGAPMRAKKRCAVW